jgi:hypothetical protein
MPAEPKDKPENLDAEDTCAADQKKREYYYDDAHGYEPYSPEADEDDAEDDTEDR